jgi:hypothetical protein
MLLDSDSDVESSAVPEQGLRCIQSDGAVGLGSDFMGNREESPTHGSSVVAVEEHPILVSPPCDIWVTKRHKPLPRYVTPETLLQKRMRRELETIGPLMLV